MKPMSEMSFFCLIIALAVGFLAYSLYENVKFSQRVAEPAEKLETLEQFTEQGVPHNGSFTFTKNGEPHILWRGETPPTYLLRSGSPCYVFDKTGKLVDFTVDEGEDSNFERAWPWRQNKTAEHETPQAALAEIHGHQPAATGG